MPTVGEVYNPLINAALACNRELGDRLMQETGKLIFDNNPGQCPNLEDGVRAAKENLRYFVQYYSAETSQKVKAFYDLDPDFKPLVRS